MFTRNVFEIELPDAKAILKVRRISASQAILVYGNLPDFFPDKDDSQTEMVRKMLTPEAIMARAKWACEGVVESGEQKLVPSLEPKEGEWSFFDLTDMDQGYLFSAVYTGVDPKKA